MADVRCWLCGYFGDKALRGGYIPCVRVCSICGERVTEQDVKEEAAMSLITGLIWTGAFTLIGTALLILFVRDFW